MTRAWLTPTTWARERPRVGRVTHVALVPARAQRVAGVWATPSSERTPGRPLSSL